MTDASPLKSFWSQLAIAPQAALLLDYDGTLAPFRVERDQATPYPGIRERIDRIRRDTNTRLVIISGRAVSDLLPLLALAPPPEIWGCHGREHLAEHASKAQLDLPDTAHTGLRKALLWIQAEGLEAYCEQKPASVALHWRGRPAAEIATLRKTATNGWKPLALDHHLEIHEFDGGLELRCPGRDKGTAIAALLGNCAADCAVAFLGDDLTDEDGFAALAGRGLGILVRREGRPTRAQWRLTPPEELLAFLDTWWQKAPRRQNPPGKEQPCANA